MQERRYFIPTLQVQVESVLGAHLVGLGALEREGGLVVAERVAEGLDPGVVDRLVESLAVPRGTLLEAVGLTEAALRRHKAKDLPLERGVWDRLYRVAQAGAAAVGFFEGDAAAAAVYRAVKHESNSAAHSTTTWKRR